MIKIAIYLGPLAGKMIDARKVENGNPGVGGTQYCMLELAHYLNQQMKYKVSILANREYLLESGIDYVKTSGDDVLCETVQNIQSDILILGQFRNSKLEQDIAQLP